jgi:hypothetical protein
LGQNEKKRRILKHRTRTSCFHYAHKAQKQLLGAGVLSVSCVKFVYMCDIWKDFVIHVSIFQQGIFIFSIFSIDFQAF